MKRHIEYLKNLHGEELENFFMSAVAAVATGGVLGIVIGLFIVWLK